MSVRVHMGVRSLFVTQNDPTSLGDLFTNLEKQGSLGHFSRNKGGGGCHSLPRPPPSVDTYRNEHSANFLHLRC